MGRTRGLIMEYWSGEFTTMPSPFQHETERVDVNVDTLVPKLLKSFIM
jgi:hypothetical protein